MKPHSIFYMIPVLGLLAVSCTSTRPINDNNVYMMKTSALPVGENLTDETSYATYKHREETNNPTAGYYNPRTQSVLNRDPRANNNSLFLMGGLYQGNFNPYWGMHRNGFYYGPGLGGFNNFYGNSFGMFNTYSWQHGYYSSPYGFGYPYSGYYNNYGNGFGNNNYCVNNGVVFNGLNPTAGYSPASANYVSGPRSTVAGVYSGTNRGGGVKLKSKGTPTYFGNTSRVTKYTPAMESKYSRTNSTASTSRTRSTPTYSRNSNGQSSSARTRTYSGTSTTGTARSNTSRGTFSSGNSNSRSTPSVGSGSSRGSTPSSSSSSSGRSGGASGSSSSGRSGGRGN